MADVNDLARRVQSLETRADKTDRSLDQQGEQLVNHEQRITALENMEAPTVSGDLDTAAILKQVNLVQTELSQVRNDL